MLFEKFPAAAGIFMGAQQEGCVNYVCFNKELILRLIIQPVASSGRGDQHPNSEIRHRNGFRFFKDIP